MNDLFLKQNKVSIYMLTSLAMIFWGISYTWSKIVFNYFTPLATIFFRSIIAAILLLCLSLFLKKFQKLKRQDLKLFLLLGIFDPFGYFLFEGYGIKHSTPAIASVIISLIPVLLPVFAYFFAKEKVTYMNIAGIVISFSGVLLVIIKEDFSFASSPAGIFLLFLAVLTSVGFNLLLKKLLNKYNILTIFTYLNIIGIIYFIPIFIFNGFHDFTSAIYTYKSILLVFALAFFASTLSFLFYAKGIQKLGITVTNIFANLIPVISAIFSWLILNEQITLRMMLGIFVVISGLIISQLRLYRISRAS
ncbi:MAG: DMT family transporter [Bacteroidia bacterium]|nr:DMT family transporter [Bacteroidia bacterium]